MILTITINGAWIIVPIIIIFTLGIIREIINMNRHSQLIKKDGNLDNCDCYTCFEVREMKERRNKKQLNNE